MWESWLCPSPDRVVVLVVQTAQLSTIQLHIQGLGLIHPDVYPIYDLLGYMDRLVLG